MVFAQYLFYLIDFTNPAEFTQINRKVKMKKCCKLFQW